jgi:hypothetical protein
MASGEACSKISNLGAGAGGENQDAHQHRRDHEQGAADDVDDEKDKENAALGAAGERVAAACD